MSAPKRGQTPHHSQPKIRKLDEDGDALPTKIESATNSLITEKMQENTAAAPRTKIKRLLVEKGNKPAKSSKQSSLTKDSSNSPPDPPVKKAKLQTATSASCGEAPSQRANSKASLKRTTSTESDEDLSSDGSKVDFFREKDDEDEARCIQKYSNKAKRKVEESSSDPLETSQDLSSSPLDPVQIDHDYGRVSDPTSLQNTGEAEDKDSTVSFPEQESHKILHDATQKVPTDTSTSETGSTETSIKVESATDEHKDVELQYQENQTHLDNKTPAFSREMTDCVTHVGEKQDETEFIKRQKDADNKTLASPEKTLCAVTGELISGSRVVDERTDSACQSESQTCLSIQSVSEENELNIKSKTKGQEVFEAAGICADKLDGVLLNVTSSVLEHVEISHSDSQPKENVKMVEFTSSNTQIDLSCQVALREEFDTSHIQAEMPETVVSLCDVNKTLENFEESPRGGVDFESPQTSACSEALVEVHLNHGVGMPDSCTDTLLECVVLHEEIQVEMLSDHLKVPEGQITPEADLQSEENCPFNEKVTKVATLAEGDSTGKERYVSRLQCSAAEIKEDVHTSHQAVTVTTQDQDVHESITNFHEAHSAQKFEPLENEETVGAECGSEAETPSVIVTQTVVTPEISNSDPPVETRKQEIQEVSESTTVTSTEIHSNVTAAKCEHMETVECAVIAEGQSGGETHLVATFKLFDSDAKVELQIQESPVNEHTTVVLEEGEKDSENANSESRNDGECVDFTSESLIEVDKQNSVMSEEVCTPIKETHSQINQEVSEHTIDICDEAQKVVEDANCATQTLSPSQIGVDVLAAVTSDEVANIAHIGEIQTQMVSEPTTETFIKVQKDLRNGNCAAQSRIKVVDNVQAAATSEKVSNVAAIEQMQISMGREPITDASDDVYTDLENAAFKSSKDAKCVSAASHQSQIEVVVDTAASEKVSKVAPIEELKSQIVSEPTMHTSVKFMGYNWKEKLKTFENNEFKVDSPTVILSQTEMDTTLAMESSSPTPSLGVNKSQTEEDMQAPENSSSTAFVVETQTLIIQDVCGQIRDDTNKELHENIVVENLQKVNNEVNSGCVTVQEHQCKSEIQVTPASVVLERDSAVEIQKSPNEMHVQNLTSEQDNTFPAVEIQNLKSHDVVEENIETWCVADEESQNKMKTTETSVLSPSAETQYQINNDVNESSANVSEQVQANFMISANESLENENKAVEECVYTAVGINKMETQSAEGLQENSQPTTTKQIPSQRGQEVCELTTDTNILVLQSSSETQIVKGFSVTDLANDTLSETVRESFTIPSTEDHENKSEAVEECIDPAEMTHETETKTPQMLEVSQPTTSENSQIQRGQELSEFTTISVSPPPPETQIQRTFDATEPSSEVAKAVQEDFKIHSSEGHENENKVIEEISCATYRTYKMVIQTAEELEERLQPTTTEQRDWEATELATDISASPPSSEIHVQKNLNITESATNTSVCNENTVVEKSLGTTERTIEMEMQAAEILLEVSQPATTEQSQNLSGQEVCELTTDANISFSPSSSETEIQKSFNVTDPANDVSETIQESFSVPLNQRHGNGNEVLTECGNTAERINKIETQSVQMLEEFSQGRITEQTQNQRVQEFSEVTTDANLSVSPASAEMQIHTSLDVTEAATNISETVQEMFTFSSNECRENEKKTFEKCADTAETNEMEMQTTEALEETFQPTPTEQTQNQRGQKVIELTVDADISVAPPLAETTIQKSINITEPASDISKPFQENVKVSPTEMNKNENKAMKEFVHTAEKTNEMETQLPELLQETSQQTITEQTQNQINDPISAESEQNKSCVSAPENQPKIDMQTSLTPEIYYQKSDVELQNQRNTGTDVGEEHKIEEMDASECENIPEIETDMEASAKSEICLAAAVEHQKHLAEETTEHTMHVSDEILTPRPIVNIENENDGQTEPKNDQGDSISGLIERADSALEEAIKVEASVRNAEGGAESSEVIIFVCDQSEDTDVIQAPEEQVKTVHQSEVEFYENQVVYEPISSPESNSGGDVCTPIQLGETISFLDLQNAEAHHILGKESNFLIRDEKSVITYPKLEDGGNVKEEMSASDCPAAVLMEVNTTSEAQCPAHAHLEQSNKIDNATHIAAINSSDSSVTDGRSLSASKQGERCDILEYLSAAELTEQMQEDTEVQDATVIMATTPASTEIEITDSLSEQMQENTGVKEATGIIVTTTPAPAEAEITDALSEQVLEYTGVQDSTANVATTTPALSKVEITDASSEQLQEETGVQDTTANMATTPPPAPTEVEITDASSEKIQEDTGVQDASANMATATPALTEVELTDASSEKMQEHTGVQDATENMVATTPASTEVEITNASSEQMQEDIEDEEATGTVVITTPAPTEVEISDASSEQVQQETGVQDATANMATATPAPTEFQMSDASSEQVQEDIEDEEATGTVVITTPALTEVKLTDASSEKMQEDTGVQDATDNMAATTPAQTEVEVADALSEQIQEDIEDEEATGIVVMTSPAPTEVKITDASSEQVQQETGVQNTTENMATATPALTKVEITGASSEKMQEVTGVQDATANMATATPALTEVKLTDASSEKMQDVTGVQDATENMVATTPASTEVEITNASSEQMQEDIEDEEATGTVVITTPAPTEVEISDASSEQVQQETGVQDATANMATATPAPTEFQMSDASSEQVQQDTGVQNATDNMAATTPAPTEVEVANASSVQMQKDIEDEEATGIVVMTSPAPTEVEISDASSEQVQQDTGVQDATANVATATPALSTIEITDASSEKMQEETGVQDASANMATATPALTEVKLTDVSSEQMQEVTGVQDATDNMVTTTPASTEVEITNASCEQMQEDIEDDEATGTVVITTPAPTEVEISDASSEQVQQEAGVQGATANMATSTPAPTEFQMSDASSEQMQEDTGVQNATDNMAATTPAPTEVEVANASSEQVQQETWVQNTTDNMAATTLAPTEVEITDTSFEQMEEDIVVKGATTNMATATSAPTEVKINASSEWVQADTRVQDATVIMATASSALIEFQITDASSEQVQEDTGNEEATGTVATTTPAPTDIEISDASSEQVQEDIGVQDATVIMATTTPVPTGGEVADASADNYVILEPVQIPESEIHFDIVTQAVAESGLSASLGPDEEIASQSMINSSPQTIILEAVAHQAETTDEVNETTVTISDEVLEQVTETNHLQDAPVSDHQSSSASVDVEMANSHHTNHDSTAAVIDNVECTLDQDEAQILEVMEIGREVVVAEEDNEEDSDVIVIKPPAQPTEGSPKSKEQVNVTKKQDASKTVKKKASAGKVAEEKGRHVEKPKKQEMNMQARTKARIAALAEQKAAAAKRSANRHQLNLLALCQEIAEDIATDSMLLKKIEEEKQAAAAAEAAMAEAIKKEQPPVTPQEAEPDNVVTPAGPEESPASETPTPELPAVQPSTADPAETKPAAEPPKRRFFTSQISVPLKAHEKKKLTRYQRLRQVELQREKMSWARVKKLKSDQTNQMFSDVDWQASFSGGFFMGSTTPPQASSPSKTPPVSQTTATQPAQPKGDSPKFETPTSETVKTGVDKTEPTKTENSETELVKTETSKTEPAKAETSKAETTKTEAPSTENRRITRQSKAQASKVAAVAPKPAPKVTRSASKRSLPAVPPPMPNGLNAQKPKPVEYKPYRPRPKYSFDDFELDDDDSLLVSPIKPNLSTHPPRPSLQLRPTAQSKPPLKPTISSQPANQATLKSQTAPPGSTRPTASVQAHLQSAKPKPTAAAQLKSTPAAASKPVPSTSTQLKTPIVAASQSKPASAPPRPAASAPPQLKPAGVNVTKQFAPAAPQPNSSATTETKPAAAKAGDASVPQKTEKPPSPENGKCKNTADPLSSLPASSLPSVESTNSTKRADKSPAEDATKTAKMAEKTSENQDSEAKPQDAATLLSDASLQKEVKKLKEADKDGTQTIIDAGQKHFGPVACSGCGMLYSAANPEDEAQHLLFHNQFISAVKYVGWKKERILAEYPDGKIILVLPDDPKYALKKVEEIREMVDNDLGFQQVETKCPSKTKTFLFISIDKKVAGCLIAEHIQEGYRVIEETLPEGSEREKVLFERQKAWCCSTTPDPAICGISRIWVVSMMRRRGIATRMIECLRNNFIYGSYLRKDEIAFSDPTPDGKLFASHYFGTSQFLVYNFVSGLRSLQPKTQAV